MFKRIRQLRISLAAKCQLLFGTAVVMIISAALFVPWQRIEQLTDQLNERAANALADEAVNWHIARHAEERARRSTTAPATAPATDPATPPAASPPADASALPAEAPRLPRLVGLSRKDVSTDFGRFEQRAQAHLMRNTDERFYSSEYERNDGTKGYRYAQPLYFDQAKCSRCHEAKLAPATSPALAGGAAQADAVAGTQPALAARIEPLRVDARTRRAGIVSVDMGSRIDANERLLNRMFLLVAGTVAGTMAIVTFYFITTRLILQPVRVLQETAEKVSKGDLNIRSDINTGDEFQQLSETFNTMLVNLRHGSDQLRAINKSLDLKLGQLAESNLALYESNRLKSEFLANVSHELRTPLNSILGFADLLKDVLSAPPLPPPAHPPGGAESKSGNGKEAPAGRSAAADAKVLRYANNILQSGRNLLELINDLLDLAKIEAGRMEIRSEPLSISDLFEGLTTILKPLAEQRRVHVVSTVAPDVPILHSDPGKLQQVLYNFLSNAIKFSPEGGRIEVAAVRDPEAPQHVRITVTDHGPGIEPEKHAVIFEKFRQIDGSVTRSHNGTGLGLAISKELTQLMGGSIGVRSARGEGATFWVVLPFRIEAGQMDMRGRMALV